MGLKMIPLPHNSHFKHVLNERTTKPAEISVCHVVWDSQHTNEGHSSHLKLSIPSQIKPRIPNCWPRGTWKDRETNKL